MDTRQIFIKNWVLNANVGVYDAEKRGAQRLRANVTLDEAAPKTPAHLNEAVDYGALKAALEKLILKEHVELLETLADRIANHCLADARVNRVTVELEKLDIFPDCECGVKLTRSR